MTGSNALVDSAGDNFLEIERRRLNERLALAVAATELGMWEVFPDGSAVWDAQTYRLYGRDPASAVVPAVIFRESLPSTELDRANHWLSSALQRKTFSSFEFSILWPDGQVRWLVAKGNAIQDETGKKTSLLGVNWDITEQKRAALALEKYQNDLSELNRKLLEQEQEIHKLVAYSLHDQLGQTLTALRLRVDTLHLMSASNSELTPHCVMLEELASKAVDEVRHVLTRLHPPLLSELGLGRALESEVNATLRTSSQPCLFFTANESALNHRWDSNVEYVSFMIAREAIANALQHAVASQIDIELRVVGSGFTLVVRDDGKGIEPSLFQSRPGHLGMLSMRERAHTLGASLTITTRPSLGTTVTLQWPKPQ